MYALKDEVQELRQVSCHLSVSFEWGHEETTVLDLKPTVHEHHEARTGASSQGLDQQWVCECERQEVRL